jgi:hypothetical protein
MTAGLLTLRQAAPLLACRDMRTARKRLSALGVPVVNLDGRVLVDPRELDRAIRAASRPLSAGSPATSRGVVIAPGARLWDGART